MRIRMLTIDAGPNGARHPGEIHEVTAQEAKALIDGGYAIPVREPVVEKTDAEKAPEKAAAPTKPDKK